MAKPTTVFKPSVHPFESLIDPHAPIDHETKSTEGWVLGILPDYESENRLAEHYLLPEQHWWAVVKFIGFC